MHAAKGIVTSRGGMTSHAAVSSRGMGRACVAGAGDLHIDYAKQQMSVKGTTVKARDVITIDGSTGEVMLGEVPTIQPELSGDFAAVMSWADSMRRLKVRANAETPLDTRTGLKFGAEGIGLCRTEHMFFDSERIIAVREMIVAEDEAGRRAALAKLEPVQRQDFVEIFTIMEGLPITVRLLDPPLHEFLPKTDEEMADVAKAAGTDVATVRKRAQQLHESNPMLGHRGCRLGISYPEIYEMQARAIFGAMAELTKKGKKVLPEVMIPLVATKKEFDVIKTMVDQVAGEVMAATGVTFKYLVGTMIELPRAALRAGDIAEKAEFFSFGTNDLTQTTFGLSRDDAASFLPDYYRNNVLEHDPFVTIDQDGVGELVQLACERGRKTRPELKLGICGEHGGDPNSVKFCHRAGLDYVSAYRAYRAPLRRRRRPSRTIATSRGRTRQDKALQFSRLCRKIR